MGLPEDERSGRLRAAPRSTSTRARRGPAAVARWIALCVVALGVALGVQRSAFASSSWRTASTRTALPSKRPAAVVPVRRLDPMPPVLATAQTWHPGALALLPALLTAQAVPPPPPSWQVLPTPTLALAPPPPAPGAEADASARPPDGTRRADVRAKLISSRSVPPFWIDRTYDTHHTRAIGFPPLFVHRTPAPGAPQKLLHVDASLTFGWGTTDGKRRWLSPAALFFGSFSERKTVWGTAALLMGYRRTGDQYSFGQFPTTWAWGTKYVKNLLVFPFHYQQKRPDGFRGVSALVFWYGHKNRDDTNADNDRGWFVAAPVFYRFRRGVRRFDFAFAYLAGEHKLEGRRWLAVAPFAVWHQSEFGNRESLFTLAWVRRTDRARGLASWSVPVALTGSFRSRDRKVFTATPLVWRTQNVLRGSKFTLAGPFGVYEDERQKNQFFAPVWLALHDRVAGSTLRILAPLAVARTTKDRTGVWTVLGGGMRTQRGFGAFALPGVVWVGKRDDGRTLQGALGMFWHAKRPEGPKAGHTFVAGPLGFYDRRGEKVRAGFVPLVVLAGRNGTTRWQVVTPLLWHAHDPTQRRRTLVGGPVYHHRRGDDLHGGIAPLVFWGGGSKLRYGIAPLLLVSDTYDVRKRERLTMTPLFVRHSAPGQRTIGAAGIVWDAIRDGGNERHTAVLPFYYGRKQGDERLTISLVGGRFVTPKATTDVWGPWVSRRTENRTLRGVAPLVWTTREQTPEGLVRSVSVVPFLIQYRSRNDDLDMFSPLVWRREIRGERARKNLAVVPFYFRQRQPTGVDVDGGLGFFWSRDRTRRTHTLIAGPFYHRLSRKSVHTGLFPLSWWMDSESKRRLIALPTIVHIRDKKAGEHTTVAAPLWFDRRRANGRRTWGAFPFVFGGKRLYNFTRFSVVVPGFVDTFRIQRNARFTGFVPLLFRHRKCGFLAEDDPSCTYTLWGSVPLFLYGKDGRGRITHGSLLYVYDRDREGMKLYTPLFGLNNRPGKVLGWYAGPLAMKTTNTHKRFMLFPLVFRRQHRLEDRNLTLVVPPVFIGRVREDRRFFEAGLVVWQVRQQHKVATAVLPPLFFHSHAYAQRRMTWVAPLFLRDDNWGADEAWTAIGPVAYVQRRKGENLDFVQFPLVWHIERGENHGTFGAFVWWDFARKGRRVQLAPGAYLRVAGRRLDAHVIGPGLGWWWRGRGATEGDFHWRGPLGLFGAGVEAGRRYIALFGGRIDRGPGKAPPERVRKPRAKRGKKVAPQTKARGKAGGAATGRTSWLERRAIARSERRAAQAMRRAAAR